MNMIQEKNRVVITGVGIICPLAHDVEDFWQALMTGKSGMAETTVFDASTFPSKFCAEVKNYDLTKYTKNPHLHKYCNRGAAFAVGAAVQACKQAKIDIETQAPKDGIDRTRMGVYLGAGEGPVDDGIFFDSIINGWSPADNTMNWGKLAEVLFGRMTPMFEIEQEPAMTPAHITMLTGARGPTRNCLTACAASTQAIGEAMMMIRSGDADVMISGGAHSMIHPLGITGFNRLTALSTRNDSPQTASRPFTASRDGFVIGEGAAVLVLESLSRRKKEALKFLRKLSAMAAARTRSELPICTKTAAARYRR